jgi:hypothetical protein
MSDGAVAFDPRRTDRNALRDCSLFVRFSRPLTFDCSFSNGASGQLAATDDTRVVAFVTVALERRRRSGPSYDSMRYNTTLLCPASSNIA